MIDPKFAPDRENATIILHVDDKEASRYAVTRILKKAGYKVLEASTGQEALNLVFQEYPDLVLLDVNLPDLDGFEVCKKIKADRHTASIPVVHLSATYVQSKHRIEGLEGGADGYLVQPIERQELLATIRAFLRLRRVEQNLLESEKKYRKAAEITGQAVYNHDLRSGAIEWSGQVEKITGYTTRELNSKSFIQLSELFHPENRSWLIEKKKRLAKDNKPYKLEYRFCKKDGSVIYVEEQGDFLDDHSGKAIRIVGSIKDISDWKEAEQELRAREEKYRSLVHQSVEMLYLHDLQGNFIEVNSAAVKRTGYTQEELLKLNVFDLHPDTSHREKVIRQWRGFRVGDSLIIEGEHKCKDGSLFPVEVNTGKVAIGDQEYILALVRDITDRKRAEEKLRENESSLRLLTDNMLDLVSQMDAEGVFQYVSPSHRDVLGYKPEELIGQSFFDFIHPEDLDILLVKGTEAKSNRYRSRADFRFRHKQGHYLWMEVYVNSISGESGEVVGIVACSREITERKKAEDKMADTLEKYRKGMEGIVHSMGIAIEKRDPYTAGHQVRVARLAAAIASEMGLDQDTIDGLVLAAEIHDIGKIAVPAEILTKPGELSELEYSLIQNHPRSGSDILKDIEFPWPIAQIIDQHHEKMDGTGYPEGITGESILLEAKIICVADVVEAISSHRPYRASLGIDKALEEISHKRGRLFDPEVVDACLRLFRKNGFSLDGQEIKI